MDNSLIRFFYFLGKNFSHGGTLPITFGNGSGNSNLSVEILTMALPFEEGHQDVGYKEDELPCYLRPGDLVKKIGSYAAGL